MSSCSRHSSRLTQDADLLSKQIRLTRDNITVTDSYESIWPLKNRGQRVLLAISPLHCHSNRSFETRWTYLCLAAILKIEKETLPKMFWTFCVKTVLSWFVVMLTVFLCMLLNMLLVLLWKILFSSDPLIVGVSLILVISFILGIMCILIKIITT